jgi:hypothetical protein
MLPQRLDTVLAFKAISLSDSLSGTEKCVAAAIVDSFNRRTGQCDPSFDRIAHLIGKSRRTVIRAVERLVRARFFVKARHGGHFHRNSYEPHWALFRQLEVQWKLRQATRHWAQEMSPSTVPKLCHVVGDESGTQTNLINKSKETCLQQEVPTSPVSVGAESGKGNSRKELSDHLYRSHDLRLRSSAAPLFNGSNAAARSAAERRWNGALMKRLIGEPELYAKAIDAIDQSMQDAATEAEMRSRGSGMRHLIEQLAKKGTPL